MILYFTGTGNSEFVAKRIGLQLSDEVLNLFERIKRKNYEEIVSKTPFVVCTPTYAWKLPEIVCDYLRKVKLSGNQDVYFVLTCGDSIGNAAGHAKKLCQEKGMNFRGLRKVIMPENYIAMFDAPEEKEAREIIRKSLPVMDDIARSIRENRFESDAVNFFGLVESSLVNRAFYRFSVKDKAFKAKDACNGCGLCLSICPLNNIVMEKGKPKWMGNCTHCMACICHCPKEAIEYGKASVGKPRYKCVKDTDGLL